MTDANLQDMPTRIASRLEACFVARGFLDPGVDALRDASKVSLRTLYKYYPSREAMVVGALEHRHERYLNFIADGAPTPGPDATINVFGKAADWMAGETGTGCLFLNALATHRDNTDIRKTVDAQKTATRDLFTDISGRPDLADALFLLHEGAVAAWPILGRAAFDTAAASAKQLFKNTNEPQ